MKMKIEIEKSGGFAGIINKAKIDTEKLSVSEGEHLKKLLRKCDIQSIHNKNKQIPRGSADYAVYRISIINGKNVVHAEFNEFAINESLRTLINLVASNSGKR